MSRSLLLLAAAPALAVAACTPSTSQESAPISPVADVALPAPASAPAVAPPAPASAPVAAPPAPGSASRVTVSKNRFGEPELKIDPADQTCRSNDDCGIRMTQCDCDCGSPVNLSKTEGYPAAWQQMCQHYEGRLCKMPACEDKAICDRGVCKIKP